MMAGAASKRAGAFGAKGRRKLFCIRCGSKRLVRISPVELSLNPALRGFALKKSDDRELEKGWVGDEISNIHNSF
jgi:hypothetical protein